MPTAAIIYTQSKPEHPAMIRQIGESEEQLLAGCVQKDRQAQERFYRKYHGKMLAVCLRYTRDRETALDMMNRGFLRVFNKIDQYRRTGSLEGWIKVIMVHAIADYFRQQKKEQVAFTGDLPESEQPFTIPADGFAKETLQKALQQLPETQRCVFNLFAIDGYRHKEIADMLELNENTIRWLFAEAKKKLQQILTHSL
jgi:RNA polymerase sigma-70 factor, ECF subfamily